MATLAHVNGDIVNPKNGEFNYAKSHVIIQCVDDSGIYGSGGLFDQLQSKFPSIVASYENIAEAELRLGSAHLVVNNINLDSELPGQAVIFLIVQSSADRSRIDGVIFESALRDCTNIIQTFGEVEIHSPRLGYGTNLSWTTVESMFKKYFLNNGVPCYIFHFKRSHNILGPTNKHNLQTLPAKRQRKQIIRDTHLLEDSDDSYSSSSEESTEGEYEPSGDEDNFESESSESEESESREENEESEDDELWKRRKQFRKKVNNITDCQQTGKEEAAKNGESGDSFFNYIDEPDTTNNYFAGMRISFHGVPYAIFEQCRAFVLKHGGKIIMDGDDLLQATHSIVHNAELMGDENLNDFKRHFDPDCIHVNSLWLLDALLFESEPVDISSFVV